MIELKKIKKVTKNDDGSVTLTMDGVARTTSNGVISSINDILTKKVLRTDKENKSKIDAFTKKHGDFETALNSIRYTVWDMITLDEYSAASSSKPYNSRLGDLSKKLIFETNFGKVSIIDTRIVQTFEEAMDHFKELLGDGEEGTVLKSTSGAWKDGKPAWQIKLKLELNLDLKIVGFNYGTKGSKNEFVISSLNAESACGLLKTSPQGLNEKLMKEITANQDALLGTIIEIKCSGLSTDSSGAYSVLYPAFKHYRDDKKEANTLEECIEIQNAALGLTN
jgi:ATP-dependent DNA ligase